MLNFLVVSNGVLWVAVIALALVVFAQLRQIGVLYERMAPAGALMIHSKLQVGAQAPQMQIDNLNDGSVIDIGGNAATGKSQLLFFVSPDCPVCKTLLPVIKSASSAERHWLTVILASDGEADQQQRFIADHGLQDFPFANSQALGLAYGVSRLPFAVLIDDDGVIKSMGLINSREHLESLFEAKERDVASIQDYMQRNTVVDFDPVQEYGNEVAR